MKTLLISSCCDITVSNHGGSIDYSTSMVKHWNLPEQNLANCAHDLFLRWITSCWRKEKIIYLQTMSLHIVDHLIYSWSVISQWVIFQVEMVFIAWYQLSKLIIPSLGCHGNHFCTHDIGCVIAFNQKVASTGWGETDIINWSIHFWWLLALNSNANTQFHTLDSLTHDI